MMKFYTWLFTIICFFYINFAQAQFSYYSMTSEGGAYGIGTIFKTDVDGNNPAVIYDFKTEFMGQNPRYMTLLELDDGYLYGTTANGGHYSRGVIFRYHPDTKKYETLHSFDGDDGQQPYGGLVVGNDKMLYGTCNKGGIDDKGIIFRYNLLNNTFENIFDLAAKNCSSPYNKLYQHKNGLFYGTTSAGGDNNRGALFEFDAATLDFNVIHSFEETTGRAPTGSVIALGDVLYGMATFGGGNKAGVIFSYNLNAKTYNLEASFDNKNGRAPRGNLTPMSNGKLYGLTNNGGKYNMGALFEFDPNTLKITHKDNLSIRKGNLPFGDLIKQDNNTLIGFSSSGGINNIGSIFDFNIQADSIRVLKYFGGKNGSGALGSPVVTKDGSVFGTTISGGFNSQGVLFEYDQQQDSIITIVNFNHAVNGSNPCGTLLQASDGKLYGLTSFGGEKTSYGVAFMIDPKTDEYTKIEDFNFKNGAFPYGSFIEGDDRILYGMTYGGGDTSITGSIIALDIKTNQLTAPVFLTRKNGAFPFGNLTRVQNGKYFGLTSNGGQYNLGVLFEFDPNAKTVNVKHHFSPNEKTGHIPYGSLTSDGNGNLYGMTNNGGSSNNGCIFKFNHMTDTYDLLVSFGGRISGSNPRGNVLVYDNKLYGVNLNKGTFRAGVVFEYDLSTERYNKVFTFDTINGRNSTASLTLTKDNKILGYATSGGTFDVGTAFEFTPGQRNSFKKLWDFDFDLGSLPIYGFPALSDATITAVDDVNNNMDEMFISPNPVHDFITVHTHKNDGIIQHIICYTIDGQKVLTQDNSNNDINISSLNPGNYVLQVITNEGETSIKFIKQE